MEFTCVAGEIRRTAMSNKFWLKTKKNIPEHRKQCIIRPSWNILKGFFFIKRFSKKKKNALKETKVKIYNFSSIVDEYWRQVQKNDERTERQTVAEWRHLNLICNTLKHICNTLKQSPAQNFNSTSQRDILSSQRNITPSKIDAKWQHSNLLCSTLKQSHVQKFQLNVSEHAGEKVRKTVNFLYSKFQKRHNSFKNWRKVMTLKLDL